MNAYVSYIYFAFISKLYFGDFVLFHLSIPRLDAIFVRLLKLPFLTKRQTKCFSYMYLFFFSKQKQYSTMGRLYYTSLQPARPDSEKLQSPLPRN